MRRRVVFLRRAGDLRRRVVFLRRAGDLRRVVRRRFGAAFRRRRVVRRRFGAAFRRVVRRRRVAFLRRAGERRRRLVVLRRVVFLRDAVVFRRAIFFFLLFVLRRDAPLRLAVPRDVVLLRPAALRLAERRFAGRRGFRITTSCNGIPIVLADEGHRYNCIVEECDGIICL